MSVLVALQGGANDRNATLVLTGGGVISVARLKAAMAQAAITGGGVVGINWGTARSRATALTGGGRVIITATKGGAVLSSLTGGGVVTISAQHGATVTAQLTGGGRIVATSTKGGFTVGGPTGGGVIVWQYEVASGGDNRNVTFVVTGGGDITITYERVGGDLTVEVDEDPQMASGRGPRRGRTEFDEWTIPMDDERILELYVLRKTR